MVFYGFVGGAGFHPSTVFAGYGSRDDLSKDSREKVFFFFFLRMGGRYRRFSQCVLFAGNLLTETSGFSCFEIHPYVSISQMVGAIGTTKPRSVGSAFRSKECEQALQ